MSKAEVTLPAALSSVPTARHFVESVISSWGLHDLSWPATLVVSELAANAALHARGEDFTVRIRIELDCVRLEVVDHSLRLPQQRSYSAEATTGRGLRLVSELAQEWGVTTSADGKTVWVVLGTTDSAGGGDEEVDVEALMNAFGDDVATATELPHQPRAFLHPDLAIAA
jgi:anti-sigma regulatory factor (Ser/Thr protein kinase)